MVLRGLCPDRRSRGCAYLVTGDGCKAKAGYTLIAFP
jgi:hypothetical protein